MRNKSWEVSRTSSHSIRVLCLSSLLEKLGIGSDLPDQLSPHAGTWRQNPDSGSYVIQWAWLALWARHCQGQGRMTMSILWAAEQRGGWDNQPSLSRTELSLTSVNLEFKSPKLSFRLFQALKSLFAMQETPVWSLGWEDPLEKEMEIHSSILAWRIHMHRGTWGLQSMGLQRVGHDWATNTFKLLFGWRKQQLA